MEMQDIVCFIFLTVPVASIQIIQESLPNYGNKQGSSRLPHYKTVLELTGHSYIRYSVKAANDAFLMFSERPVNSINYDTDTEYVELTIGGWFNAGSRMGMGTMDGQYISEFYIDRAKSVKFC